MEHKIKNTDYDPNFLRYRLADRRSKRILINNTRRKRFNRFLNNRLFFILGIDDDDENDDPGVAAAPAPDPTPYDPFTVSLAEMLVDAANDEMINSELAVLS